MPPGEGQPRPPAGQPAGPRAAQARASQPAGRAAAGRAAAGRGRAGSSARAGGTYWTGAWHRRAAARARGEPDGSGDRFGLLLLILIVSYLMSSFLASFWVNAIQIILFVGVAGLAIRTGHLRHRTGLRWVVVACAGSVIAVALALTHTEPGAGLASLWSGLVLLFTVVLIVRRILRHPVITVQSIFGAVSAYMMLGLMFAAFYAAMYHFGGGHFFASGEPDNIKTFQYFSFTTLTTLGYGDFTAAASGGRSVAVMEALFGQVFLATLVARLVAAFRPQARGNRRDHAQPRRGSGRRGPQERGPRRLVPGRRQSPRRRRQPGAVRGTSSPGRGRPARK